uniref:Glycoprotease family protein n=1 Tax=Candidatus Kentrum sp. DK TaxID=2126562 RepID=A0A450SWD1_9GAMM|nr:MAG: Glycoprotease family protein [Candidatus Kentron sp. DK]
MTLLLALETSWNRPRVILGDGANQLFDSHPDPTEARSRQLSDQVAEGLGALGAGAADIGAITINVGPGGLSAIRAGVAFANALAFSRSIPIYPFNHFEIIARQALDAGDLPTVCAVPAAGEEAYLGLVRGGRVEFVGFGPLPALVEALGAGREKIAVAGRLRPRLLSLLHPAKVTDTLIESPDGGVLFEMGLAAWRQAEGGRERVSPLTEESALFQGAL